MESEHGVYVKGETELGKEEAREGQIWGEF